MRYQDRRDEIVCAFLSFFENEGVSKDPALTVTKLTKKIGISRKTFYYYFSDLDDLARWIFRRDLGDYLMHEFDARQLVYEAPDASKYSAFPHYARVIDENKLMHQRVFFTCFVRSLYRRRLCYRNLFRENRKDGLASYLLGLYSEELYQDAKIVLDNRDISEQAFRHIAYWLTCAFLYEMINWISVHDELKRWDDVAPFNNIMHEVLYMYRICPFDMKEIGINFPASWRPGTVGKSFSATLPALT